MTTLKVFKLTDYSILKDIEWNNFLDSYIEIVDKIEIIDDSNINIDEIMHKAGYGNSDIYGCIVQFN